MTRAQSLADVFTLSRLAKESPAWTLLRAHNAPAILAILSATFKGENRPIAAHDFISTVEPLLADIREQTGEELPKTATAYVNDWVKAGYLVRRSPKELHEETYELSPDSHTALDYAMQLANPQHTVTKSRLSTLMASLHSLAAETDPDEATAIARLEAQRDSIQRQIDSIHAQGVNVIAAGEATERAREILSLVSDLPADFARVQAEVEKVNVELRQSIVEDDRTAADVLDNVFRGVDMIEQSEAGKAFGGFYDLLLNPELSHRFDATLESVMSRDFVVELEPDERLQLQLLMSTLDSASGQVHDSMTNLSRSLRRFVQSREAESQQALAKAINEANAVALQIARKGIIPGHHVCLELELSTHQAKSVSSWKLFDPQDYRIEAGVEVAESGVVDLEEVRRHIRESEIDWEELAGAVNNAVKRRGVASVGDVLQDHPATQGVASVIGVIALVEKHGRRTEGTEYLRWDSQSGQSWQARYPVFVFDHPIGGKNHA